VVETIVRYARDHNLSRIIVGRDHVRNWRPWHASFADRIGRHAPDLDVIQVAREDAQADRGRDEQTDESLLDRLKAPWRSFAMSAAFCALATLIAMPLHSMFELANIAMLFLMAVVMAAVRYGLGPAVAAAFFNVAAFDFFFVSPRFSFAVSDAQYLMTFAVMLAVGLVTAKLTADLKFQARVASRREQRVRALYEMSRDLSGALMPEQIAEISQRFAETGFGARSAIVLADEQDRLRDPIALPGGLPAVDMGICQWAYDHSAEAGCGTDTLAGSPLLYVPLKAPMRLRGVLALEPRHPRRLMAPEQRRLLDTFARLIAISLERVHYVDVAQTTTLQMESERLRNSLLSAISHDLRTPLTALVGLADSMSMTQPPPTGQQLAIATSMREVALRMNSLVNNLLDMARLQSGAVRLNRQWQPLEEVVGSALKSVGPILGGWRTPPNTRRREAGSRSAPQKPRRPKSTYGSKTTDPACPPERKRRYSTSSNAARRKAPPPGSASAWRSVAPSSKRMAAAFAPKPVTMAVPASSSRCPAATRRPSSLRRRKPCRGMSRGDRVDTCDRRR
jgi:two-component system sensor histidine kinase KdpD